MLGGRRVLLGVTGGIAAYKAAQLVRLITGAGADVTVVMTEAASRFVGPETFAALTHRPVHTSLWESPGEVLHVRLAHETELAIVAPATARLLARLAVGMSDDLLTSTLLEYGGPIVLAPAMHTGMWEHPATRSNVETLVARGVRLVGPESGPLAHGDEGLGRMSEPEVILEAVVDALGGRPRGDLDGRVFVVTAGPTYEAIDPVRFIGNHSTGAMGIAIATEALRRGAEVRLVLGPGTLSPPPGVTVEQVVSADQMQAAVMGNIDAADVVVMAAAVADFRPKHVPDHKIKKDEGVPELALEPTPDILHALSRARRPEMLLVGFAAETNDVEAAGRAKLASKAVDLLVANEVGRAGTGFGSETNHAAILDATGVDEPMRVWTKAELASAVVDRIVSRLG